MHTQDEIKTILEVYFKEIADVYGIETAFLYGSWARGYPKKSSIGNCRKKLNPAPKKNFINLPAGLKYKH